jgi:hypothetical protein
MPQPPIAPLAVDWHALGYLCDAVIDAQWSERLGVQPWTGIGGYTTGIADISRPAFCAAGEVFTGAAVMGLGGSMARSASDFAARMAEGEIIVTLPAAAIVTGQLRSCDRITRLDFDAQPMFEIARIIGDDGFGRTALYCVRL